MEELGIDLKNKLQKLNDVLQSMHRVVVAYSGGVDSSFLAYHANVVLGTDAMALMFTTQVHTASEIKEAFDFAHEVSIPLETISINVLDSEIFKSNPRDRCYHCKLLLFKKAVDFATKNGYDKVVDGSNVDDMTDFRPGAKALRELGIRSPLQEAQLTKNDIRKLSQYYQLKTWNKEAMACLATRVPYGERISCAKLNVISEVENILRLRGYTSVRARFFEPRILRIEVAPNLVPKALDEYDNICADLRSLNFETIEIDERGYKQGSLND